MDNSSLLALLFLLLVHQAASSDNHHGLKTLQFSLFQHETANKNGFMVVKGLDAGTSPSQNAAPFGSISLSYNPLTTEADPSSHVVGILEGTFVTSSLDGLQTISIAKFTMNTEGHKGSVSILGSINNIRPSIVPVVGGTGDFMLVQGYVTCIPVDLVPPNVTYKVEFHLIWPPYATMEF